MKTWRLAHGRIPCGAVAECWIEKGAVYLELSGPKWSLKRCADHAGCEPPAELPPDAAEPVRLRRLSGEFTSLAELTQSFDVRKAQAGDRD